MTLQIHHNLFTCCSLTTGILFYTHKNTIKQTVLVRSCWTESMGHRAKRTVLHFVMILVIVVGWLTELNFVIRADTDDTLF